MTHGNGRRRPQPERGGRGLGEENLTDKTWDSPQAKLEVTAFVVRRWLASTLSRNKRLALADPRRFRRRIDTAWWVFPPGCFVCSYAIEE